MLGLGSQKAPLLIYRSHKNRGNIVRYHVLGHAGFLSSAEVPKQGVRNQSFLYIETQSWCCLIRGTMRKCMSRQTQSVQASVQCIRRLYSRDIATLRPRSRTHSGFQYSAGLKIAPNNTAPSIVQLLQYKDSHKRDSKFIETTTWTLW